MQFISVDIMWQQNMTLFWCFYLAMAYRPKFLNKPHYIYSSCRWTAESVKNKHL